MPRHSGGPGGTSHKHHATKRGNRSPYGYRRRLTKRGLTKAPPMPKLESLRKKQSQGADEQAVEVTEEFEEAA